MALTARKQGASALQEPFSALFRPNRSAEFGPEIAGFRRFLGSG